MYSLSLHFYYPPLLRIKYIMTQFLFDIKRNKTGVLNIFIGNLNTHARITEQRRKGECV